VADYSQQGYYDPLMSQTGEMPRRSGLAITALVFSILGIIPCCGAILGAVGVLLGLVGLFTISPPRKGKGMCGAAIIIGLIFIALWVGLMMWGMKKVGGPIEKGPDAALREGFAGNWAGFRNELTGAAAAATDAEVEAYIEGLRAQYGEYQSIRIDDTGRRNVQPQFGNPEIPMPYLVNFSQQSDVPAEAVFVIVDQATGQWQFKWGSIEIDGQAFPASATSGGAAPRRGSGTTLPAPSGP
jgi:hypothetical protein